MEDELLPLYRGCAAMSFRLGAGGIQRLTGAESRHQRAACRRYDRYGAHRQYPALWNVQQPQQPDGSLRDFGGDGGADAYALRPGSRRAMAESRSQGIHRRTVRHLQWQ